MDFLFDWVKQIILFLLIGTILEMLLPSNNMKKYVHFVFGLLFLLILAKPIFYLFQADITEEITLIEQQMELDGKMMETTKLRIEKQKEDIQAEQVAYIWNELKNQYKEEANIVLQEQHNVQINQLTFENELFNESEFGTFTKIIVTIEPHNVETGNSVHTVERIEISPGQSQYTPSIRKNLKEIERTLRQIWQLEDDIATEIMWEGGTM